MSNTEPKSDPIDVLTVLPDKFVEDPLVAALPPNTDYITYLTILEYQLTPKNLPTLNKLLQDDDGTLASEIGWDLLKLVLPILRVEPDKARECLDIIARRGNPREVILRVAEEFETLGHDDSDAEADPEGADDDLPTFAGEAPRVHLGDMKLDVVTQRERPKAREDELEPEDDGPDVAIEELKLQALLDMLGPLHPRIKTQHPSRFLATSLPAALSAYRRLGMRYDSTLVFLNTLSKLMAKRRPALPPRVSTSDALKSMTANAPDAAGVKSTPLPDPESKSEKAPASQATASNEAAINERLVQAVLLEIADEYTAASLEAQPPLTARLRARFESQSITSTRKAQLETLTSHPELERADSLRNKFVSAAQDLQLDVQSEILKLNESLSEDIEADEASDYPTSPSQIPFSATGLLLLYSAQQYLRVTTAPPQTPSQPPSDATKPTLHLLEVIDRQFETDTRLRNSTPAIDSILSLLYIIFCIPPSSVSSTSAPIPATTETETLSLAIYNILADIFTTCPDPDLRDNAHHIASHMLHGHCQRETRLKIIQGLLKTDTSAAEAVSQIQEAQTGNLRSIAVGWVKDEIWPTQSVQNMMNRFVGERERERGLPLQTVGELVDLVFPVEKIQDVPANGAHTGQDAEQVQALALFAAELPFYISSLNLLWLVAKHLDELDVLRTNTEEAGASASASATPSTQPNLDVVLDKGEAVLAKLESWKDYLVARLSCGKTADTGEEGDLEVDGVSLSDIFAFEDAVGRARLVVPVRTEA